MADKIDYAQRRIRADAARAGLRVYRASLVLEAKKSRPVASRPIPQDTPRQRAADEARARFRALNDPEAEAKKKPYNGVPVNHRPLKQAASETTYAATRSVNVPEPVPGMKPKAL